MAIFLLRAVAGMALVTGMCRADPAPSTLTIRITHVPPRGGDLRIGVYTEESFAHGAYKPAFERTIPSGQGVRQVTFVGINPGQYAVKVVQDINRDGRADHTILGSRCEPVGYSRNYSHKERPDFRDVRFSVTKGDNRIIVRMY